MSILGKRISARAIGAMAVLMSLVALVPALSKTPTREITLVVKGMAFYAEGDLRTPNPTLDLKAGERVRIILRNQDRGLTHDFAVPVLDKRTDQITWNETDDVTLSVPDRPGTYQYECGPHRMMMRGTIRVY